MSGFCVCIKKKDPLTSSNIPVVIINVFVKLGVNNEELIKTKKLEIKTKITPAIIISLLFPSVKFERDTLAKGFIIANVISI